MVKLHKVKEKLYLKLSLHNKRHQLFPLKSIQHKWREKILIVCREITLIKLILFVFKLNQKQN
jgi:hypothetical protein